MGDRTLARGVYGVLLALHPRGFRGRFGAEMMAIFDETVAAEGAGWLLGDGVRSLLRQRVLRREDTRTALQLGLLAGEYPDGWPPHLRLGRLVLALLLTMTSVFLFPRNEGLRRIAVVGRVSSPEGVHGSR